MSFGNFDFDPQYYPTPKQFIENLSTYGFDFQVSIPVAVRMVRTNVQ